MELPFSALQTPVTAARVCGLNMVVSQPTAGPHVRPNQHSRFHPVNVEIICEPRLPENDEFSLERALPDYGSSGSNHDPSSVSLFAMVHEFIENDGAGEQGGVRNGSECRSTNEESSYLDGAAQMPSTIQSLAFCKDSMEERLLRDTKLILNSIVTEVGHVCDDGKVPTMAHSCLRRTVMSRLQKMGYVAAVCKTKWDHFCGVPAGEHEYIDVLPIGGPSKLSERLLVDINFQAEFEIARPTDEYAAIWQLLPPIFVGSAERLKQIIQIMSEAIKQSLHARGLHLPPWRKLPYVKAKWFSSYKRTVNTISNRPCREGVYVGNNPELAVRGDGLDVTGSNTLQLLYHDAGSELVPGDNRDSSMPRKRRDEITVLMTEWQPPAMVPRYVAPHKQGRVTGLTSLLKAQSPSCTRTLAQAM